MIATLDRMMRDLPSYRSVIAMKPLALGHGKIIALRGLKVHRRGRSERRIVA